ncbi:MAG: FtsQ-type POTRA domain-containing protein [Bdellovibrionota bacterium]
MKLKKSTRVFIVVFVLASTLGFFIRSSFFNIEKIKVDAGSIEIKKLVEKELSSLQGVNMWEMEAGNVSAKLRAKSRSIESVSIQRHWPSTLRVQVEERKAIAQTFIDGEMWIIDGKGVTFRKKLAALPLYWPIPSLRKNYNESLEWLAADSPRGVNGLTWDKELGLILLYEKGTKIIMGRENFSENWRKAREVLEFLKSKNLQAQRIDATYNNRAVVSL